MNPRFKGKGGGSKMPDNGLPGKNEPSGLPAKGVPAHY